MTSEIRNCEFRFQCPKTWDSLQTTEKLTVRFCPNCQRTVHYCVNKTQLYDAIVKNQCVAVEIKEKPNASVRLMLGDISPPPYKR
jgi:hypothetical protein